MFARQSPPSSDSPATTPVMRRDPIAPPARAARSHPARSRRRARRRCRPARSRRAAPPRGRAPSPRQPACRPSRRRPNSLSKAPPTRRRRDAAARGARRRHSPASVPASSTPMPPRTHARHLAAQLAHVLRLHQVAELDAQAVARRSAPAAPHPRSRSSGSAVERRGGSLGERCGRSTPSPTRLLVSSISGRPCTKPSCKR